MIVSQSFVRRFFGDAHAIGRRIRPSLYEDRWTGDKRRWLEIVGIVPDFPAAEPNVARGIPGGSVMYRTVGPDAIYPVNLSIHVPGAGTARAAARMRQVTAALEPALQLRSVITIAALYDRRKSEWRMIGLVIAIVTASVLLLSAAGIYAMMSVAVTRRRREIGIRAALGANPQRILASIFARSVVQLGAGICVGLGAALLVDRFIPSTIILGPVAAPVAVAIPVVAAIMLTVGLFASIGPARRGLRIQPTEALKQE